jgi:hypothetical protein
MAKMIEDVLVIKVSKLVKDSDPAESIINGEIQAALEQVTQELAGDGVLVEVERA